MKKEEFKELLKECKDSIEITDKRIATDLAFLNVEHGINISLNVDDNFKPFYEINEEDLFQDDIHLEEVYNLLLHGWKEKNNSLILYV